MSDDRDFFDRQSGFSPPLTNGKPCVGCGWCCLTHPCMASMHKHGYTPRCPELSWDEEQGRYLCLLMLDKAQEPGFREQLHQGEGCCAPLNPWRGDIKNRG